MYLGPSVSELGSPTGEQGLESGSSQSDVGVTGKESELAEFGRRLGRIGKVSGIGGVMGRSEAGKVGEAGDRPGVFLRT
jgi:hypothetical protein